MLNLNAQSNKSTLAVISIDTKNIEIDPMAMGNMTRVELEKLDTFNIIDKYDVQQLLDKSSVSMTNCFGKNCLVELGLKLKCDKMFSGSAEVIGKNIIITFRLLNVKSNEIEKTHVEEFLNIPEELQNMVKLSLCKMFNKPLNVNLYNKLSKKYSFDNTTNNPASDILVLDGPRMGFTSFTGKDLEIIKGKKNQGGFDLFPMLFQFGYQFEKQYLNEGNVQALFEFIPLITGLDQSYFIPSVTLLHGIRSNINGWEFAFGPSFNLSKMAKGYYDSNNHWQLENHWKESPETRGTENPNEIIKRMDSRGNYSFQSYFVFAVGKTFKSGKLNIPLNAFVIPGKDGWRYGLSFGFNAKNRK
jgi:hypothetical protein